MRRLDVEQWGNDGFERLPLIEAQAIDDDERGGAILLHHRHQELADDVDGERRPVALQVGKPFGIGTRHERRELAAHVWKEPPE